VFGEIRHTTPPESFSQWGKRFVEQFSHSAAWLVCSKLNTFGQRASPTFMS
jgi:hypothetical protein